MSPKHLRYRFSFDISTCAKQLLFDKHSVSTVMKSGIEFS